MHTYGAVRFGKAGLGYVLVDRAEIKSADGTPGRRLRFGHDEAGKPFVYQTSVFLAQDRLFLFEAGGSQAETEKISKSIEAMHASLKVRCDTLVIPNLASKTCNRW